MTTRLFVRKTESHESVTRGHGSVSQSVSTVSFVAVPPRSPQTTPPSQSVKGVNVPTVARTREVKSSQVKSSQVN